MSSGSIKIFILFSSSLRPITFSLSVQVVKQYNYYILFYNAIQNFASLAEFKTYATISTHTSFQKTTYTVLNLMLSINMFEVQSTWEPLRWGRRGDGRDRRPYFQKPITCCCDNPSGIGVIIASVCIQSTSINKLSSSSSRHDDLWSASNWIAKTSTFYNTYIESRKKKHNKKMKILLSSNYTAVLFSLVKQKKFPNSSILPMKSQIPPLTGALIQDIFQRYLKILKSTPQKTAYASFAWPLLPLHCRENRAAQSAGHDNPE